MNNKKKLLIPGWALGENAWGVTKPYLEYFSQFGQVEILTPREGIEKGDLLVLPGGMDMNPNSYGQVPGFLTGNTDVYKQYFFDVNLKQYINAGIPVFGICLGQQSLNVFFGGSLIQHCGFPYTERNEQKEILRLSLGGEDRDLVKNIHAYKVNSMHHQGVFDVTLGKDLIVLAHSQEHRNVEVFRHKDLPIYAVAYHPEEIYDELSENIVKKLLNLK